MKREELELLTKDELKEHAEVAGVTLGSLDTKGTMIDKILGEWKEPAGKAKVSRPSDERLSPLGRLHTIDGKPVNGRKFKVTIFATEQDKSDVHLIVNGHNVIIQRGKEVVLDEAYVEVLRNAVVDTVMQDPDSGMRSPQRMMVYPHQATPV